MISDEQLAAAVDAYVRAKAQRGSDIADRTEAIRAAVEAALGAGASAATVAEPRKYPLAQGYQSYGDGGDCEQAEPSKPLWDRKGDVRHDAVDRFGEARAQMRRIEQEHDAKSQFQREVEKMGERANRQQAEPGYGYASAFDEGWQARAAQSGRRAGVAEDARDAARYRWLRDNADYAVNDFWGDCSLVIEICDERIDAALAAAPTQQQEDN